MQARRVRTLVLVVVLAAPTVWWLHQAWMEPTVRFLPSGRGDWIVDPRWDIRKGSDELFPPTRFRTRFTVAEPLPERLPIRITALGDFRVAVNRRSRFDSAVMQRNWKRAVLVDLAPWLEPGDNELLIEVRNREGVQQLSGATPLRVWGDLPATGGGSLRSLATGPRRHGRSVWQAAARGLEWQPAVAAGRGEAELAGKRFRGRRPALTFALIVAAALTAAAGLACRPAPESAAQRVGAPRPGFVRRQGPALAVLVVVAGANLWNATHYPYQRSRMDWGGHVEHIRYSASTWRPALAEEGWMMYHPPLYYWAAGTVFRLAGGDERPQAALRRVQLVGALAGTVHVVLAFLVLARFGPPSPRARALALLAVGLAPMTIVTNAMISNEPFAGLASGLPLVAGAFLLARPRFGILAAAVLGLLSGLALLGKFTGLMPVAAVAVLLAGRVLAARGPPRRRAFVELAAMLLAAAAVAGPYYARNVEVYGKPFVAPHDPVTGHFFVQEPGYRTAGFYLRFGGVFSHLPERARWSSFWDGVYASCWGEIHEGFLIPGDRRAASVALLIFALAILPTAAAVAGFVRSLVRAAAREDSHVDLLFVTVSVFSLATVSAYTMIVPHFSTVKAFFLLNLLVPGIYFTAAGLARIERGLGRGRYLLDLAGLAMAALILSLYLWR